MFSGSSPASPAARTGWQHAVLDAWCDLVLGGSCVACATPGRCLCPSCDAQLPVTPFVAWPTPVPAGLVRPCATAVYAGAARRMVIEHKDEGQLGLSKPLGRMLAAASRLAVAQACSDLDQHGKLRACAGDLGQVGLVPVPSDARAVRERGADPVRRIAREATVLLNRGARAPEAGGVVWRAELRPALRMRRREADQVGLGAAARHRNVHGTMAARRIGRGKPPVVVVDDVITTGATLREAQRALEAAGWWVLGVAAVAASGRRHSGDPGPALPVPGHGG